MIATTSAGQAFDTLAKTYDSDFTNTLIGRAQRSAVLTDAFRIFKGRPRILELNCGTGEDALQLSGRGWRVLALDASQQMIARARFRKLREAPLADLRFQQMRTEDLSRIEETFDGVFSNFSGLNCVENLTAIAALLASRTTIGTPLVFCLSTRVCIWETAWYLLHGKPAKAFRRWPGRHRTSLQGNSVDVFYWSLSQLQTIFAPFFTLREVRAIGLFVPPSYVESWIANHPWLLRMMIGLDSFFSRLPLLRTLGDHMLLHFEKTEGAQP
ncbi:class I SAM-dependent DNA methyltransferase [Silvibacterium acidisoli]|uniref:class I SAM-dependent DNA methyltransferase n=1 Tax=Acidobacteriaceae bacterium ZG23-2 TaxID=2883246 RepID=UPI00406CDF4F